MQALTIKGKVVKGKGRGKTLGFPTINFSLNENPEVKHGVYAGTVRFGDVTYPAAIHYGPKPVFQEKDITLEAYLLKNITFVPQEGEVVLIKYVRDIQSFPSPKEMVEQIEKDVEEIKESLKELFPEM